jgi:hypothetical protein
MTNPIFYYVLAGIVMAAGVIAVILNMSTAFNDNLDAILVLMFNSATTGFLLGLGFVTHLEQKKSKF